MASEVWSTIFMAGSIAHAGRHDTGVMAERFTSYRPQEVV